MTETPSSTRKGEPSDRKRLRNLAVAVVTVGLALVIVFQVWPAEEDEFTVCQRTDVRGPTHKECLQSILDHAVDDDITIESFTNYQDLELPPEVLDEIQEFCEDTADIIVQDDVQTAEQPVATHRSACAALIGTPGAPSEAPPLPD